MVSDSPPDRELEWTDEGIQSAKNLIQRIDKYFTKDGTKISLENQKSIERFIYNMEKNILHFSLNKCIADIYTLFNILERDKAYLSNNPLSKKILVCLLPLVPRLANKIYLELFNEDIKNNFWPLVDSNLLEEDEIILPIQIKGKLATTINTKKDYNEDELLKDIYKIDKIRMKILDKKILKVINVQNKIINIITN